MGRTRKPTEGTTDRKAMLPVKTAVTLSAEANHKLRSAALHERKTQSELVESLILEHLGGYFTSKREKDEQEVPALRIGAGG